MGFKKCMGTGKSMGAVRWPFSESVKHLTPSDYKC